MIKYCDDNYWTFSCKTVNECPPAVCCTVIRTYQQMRLANVGRWRKVIILLRQVLEHNVKALQKFSPLITMGFLLLTSFRCRKCNSVAEIPISNTIPYTNCSRDNWKWPQLVGYNFYKSLWSWSCTSRNQSQLMIKHLFITQTNERAWMPRVHSYVFDAYFLRHICSPENNLYDQNIAR